MNILLLCDDLLFGSNILGQAQRHGMHVEQVRTPAQAGDKASASPLALAILDLSLAPDIGGLVQQLRSAGVQSIVGYGSHVDVATLKAAREAGCDQVLPRSQFVKDLPEKLPLWVVGEGRIS